MNNTSGPNLNKMSGGAQPQTEWGNIIPEDQWFSYRKAMEATRNAGVRFMLGGAFGLAGYTGRWRNTKDMDFYVLPEEKDLVVEALTRAGFIDYYPTLAYDRGWIYRSLQNEVIVDVIWGTPNRRTLVDEAWHQNATSIRLRDEDLKVIPAEELLWIKSYVMQRDRCDWPDLINLLVITHATLDWQRVINRFGNDLPLLSGLLQVFCWIYPSAMEAIPGWLKKTVSVGMCEVPREGFLAERVALLDSRPWFAAMQPADRPMKL